ncbi:uroplakin-3b-like [Pelodytes ibericus]
MKPTLKVNYKQASERIRKITGYNLDVSYISYIPQITLEPLVGKLTSSTFLLDQPQCVFNNQYSTKQVWLVVALSGSVTLTASNLGTPANYSSFQENKYYHTLSVFGSNFPCMTNSTNSLYVLQVGSETNCTAIPFCNAPLNNTYVYRVKFVVLDINGLIAETYWSTPIKLIKGMNTSVIDTWPGRRSGGMIVITSILSILMASLLVFLIFTLIMQRESICWRRRLDNAKLVSVKMKNPELYHQQKIDNNIYVASWAHHFA